MTAPTDPLHALRAPVAPVDPDPGFAAALRARITRALLAPEGNTMTASTTIRPTGPARARQHSLTPYLALTDAERTIEFYVAAFGAVRRGEPITMPDGRIGHAELAIGDSVLMLADEFPEIGLAAPATRGGVSQSLLLEVADPDAVVAAAVAAGATLDRPVADSPHGRGGVVLDPSGHRWMVSGPTPSGPRVGDLGYASLWAPDLPAAERFYTAVLGWTTRATERGREVTGLAVPLGMRSGRSRSTLVPCWVVADVDDAVDLVRAAGGTAAGPTHEPFGRATDCVDDQGLPFVLFTPPDGAGDGPAAGGPGGSGDLVGYELHVPDTTRARAFYSTVLGWRFRPGTGPEHWRVLVDDARPAPAGGLVRGDAVGVVPWFRVDDAAAAVAAVRAAGGTAVEPAPRWEGLVVECVDDQGAPFCLVQP